MKNVLLIILFGITSIYSNAENKTCNIWNNFINYTNENKQPILLDFSYAGYHNGEKNFPKPQYKIFNICDFGAIPNDQESDKEAILKAIEAAEENGSGIIFFPKGRYILNNDRNNTGPIYIRKSNIIFRGEGAGANGSEIFMKHYNEAINPSEKWTSPSLFCFNGCYSSKRLTEITSTSTKGSFSVKVKDSSNLKVGDWVCLRLSNNEQEVISRELHPYKVEYDWSSMIINGVQVYDYHQIDSIGENTIKFKEPLMREVLLSEKWFLESYPTIEEIGIEDIAFVGNWKDNFVHHKDFIHDGGWKFIEFKNVVNSWITRCRFTDVSEAVSLTTSANISATNCIITGNTGHNSMHSSGSSRTFFGGIYDIPAQWHSIGVAKHSIGTVIWRIKYSNNSCFESHASQPRATLIDACEGGFMRGRAGGAIQNNPNHLSDLVLWNFKETDESTEDFDFWANNTKYWRFMPPIIIGFHGNNTTFKKEQVLYEESNGIPVNPESLYEAQLEKRLGKLPEWILNLKDIVKTNNYCGQFSCNEPTVVKNKNELYNKIKSLQPGDTIILKNGNYNNLDISIKLSGNFAQPIVFIAQTPGKVYFGNNVTFKIIGNHIKLCGFNFSDEAENQNLNHSDENIIEIYGDYCEIDNCMFNYKKKYLNSVIMTCIGNKHPAAYCNILNCSFIDNNAKKIISFENTDKTTPIRHRISKCYFKNISGYGNSIIIGTKHKAHSRCIVENNLFDELNVKDYIITTNSGENILYNNTFINCKGKIYLSSEEKQYFINNFMLNINNRKTEFGIIINNANHIIGANYFSLNETVNPIITINKSINNEMCCIINNHFINNKNYIFDINSAIRLIRNKFFTEFESRSIIKDNSIPQKSITEYNTYGGLISTSFNKGFLNDKNASLRYDDSKIYIENSNNKIQKKILQKTLPYHKINFYDIDIINIIQYGPSLSPINKSQVGCEWTKNNHPN